MPDLYDDYTTPLALAIAEVFDAPVDAVLSADIDEDDILYGQVLSGGNVYDYAADDYAIELEYSPEDTLALNGYAQAVLDSATGIRTDSVYDAFEYARGVLRMDVGQVKCKMGGVPCGKRCLPKGQKCRKGLGANAAGVKQTKMNISGGGLAKAALAAGAAAAVAGGAAAYAKRSEIGRGLQRAKLAAIEKAKEMTTTPEQKAKMERDLEAKKENLRAKMASTPGGQRAFKEAKKIEKKKKALQERMANTQGGKRAFREAVQERYGQTPEVRKKEALKERMKDTPGAQRSERERQKQEEKKAILREKMANTQGGKRAARERK